MKKSIVAILISAAVVVSAVVAACGEPEVTAPGAVQVPRPEPIPDEERLTAMQTSIGMLISEYSTRGSAAPEYLFDISERVVQATGSLRQLDGQRAGLGMLVAQYAATGASAPEYLYDAVDQVEQAKSEVLRGVGLEQ